MNNNNSNNNNSNKKNIHSSIFKAYDFFSMEFENAFTYTKHSIVMNWYLKFCSNPLLISFPINGSAHYDTAWRVM